MIEDLFDLARVRLGEGIPLERGTVDLAALVGAVVGECQAAAPERSILRHEEGPTEGNWDSARLEQIVSNLVGNAIRHGAPDSPIEISIVGAEDQVSFSVHNGGAIAPDVLTTLFDPFQSGQRPRARREGLGLGLFIVQQLVAAHGGEVEVESTEADGTTFRVRLPRG
jgi:signal transduction histidine kinase